MGSNSSHQQSDLKTQQMTQQMSQMMVQPISQYMAPLQISQQIPQQFRNNSTMQPIKSQQTRQSTLNPTINPLSSQMQTIEMAKPKMNQQYINNQRQSRQEILQNKPKVNAVQNNGGCSSIHRNMHTNLNNTNQTICSNLSNQFDMNSNCSLHLHKINCDHKCSNTSCNKKINPCNCNNCNNCNCSISNNSCICNNCNKKACNENLCCSNKAYNKCEFTCSCTSTKNNCCCNQESLCEHRLIQQNQVCGCENCTQSLNLNNFNKCCDHIHEEDCAQANTLVCENHETNIENHNINNEMSYFPNSNMVSDPVDDNNEIMNQNLGNSIDNSLVYMLPPTNLGNFFILDYF